ncbi:MAG: NAD(P)H-dependent oxidoreductase [Chloroflexota bacterium]
MTKLQIILGSTRPNRNGKAVADWAHSVARNRGDCDVELVDIAEYDLPLLDEPYPPAMGQYMMDHTRKWSEKIAEADGYVFVTPEYNRSIPGALKNAIDYLYHEWSNESAGFVSYGSTGGTRAVEHLRGVMGELQVADVREQVQISLRTDFENFSVFRPNEWHEQQLNSMLDQVVSWAEALRTVRVARAHAA